MSYLTPFLNPALAGAAVMNRLMLLRLFSTTSHPVPADRGLSPGRIGIALAICLLSAAAHGAGKAQYPQGPGWSLADFLSAPPIPDLETRPPRWSAPLLLSPPSRPRRGPRIAIVLDDIGHRLQPGLRALELPGDVTLAILPFSPAGERLARLALVHDREIMLHAPMEPSAGVSWEGGLSRDMTEAEIREQLRRMLEAVPGVSGINNHMGSHFTSSWPAMASVMTVLTERKLYFVDSRTSPTTRGFGAALDSQVPTAERDVFLDNVRQETAIAQRLAEVIAIAERDGFAVAIGHPYPETLSVLEQELPRLKQRGIELVRVSQLLESMQQSLPRQHYLRVASNPYRQFIEQIPISIRIFNAQSI